MTTDGKCETNCGVTEAERDRRFKKALNWVNKHYGEALKRLAEF